MDEYYIIKGETMAQLADSIRTLTNTNITYTVEEMIVKLSNFEIDNWYSFYRVQTGAYSVVSNAENMYNKIKNLGYDPVIVKDNYWRINIGPFSTLSQAQQCVEKLQNESVTAIILYPS